MAIRKIGVEQTGMEDTRSIFQCSTTDDPSTYPTKCGVSSRMYVINETLHEIDHTEYFDGVHWNKV